MVVRHSFVAELENEIAVLSRFEIQDQLEGLTALAGPRIRRAGPPQVQQSGSAGPHEERLRQIIDPSS